MTNKSIIFKHPDFKPMSISDFEEYLLTKKPNYILMEKSELIGYYSTLDDILKEINTAYYLNNPIPLKLYIVNYIYLDDDIYFYNDYHNQIQNFEEIYPYKVDIVFDIEIN